MSLPVGLANLGSSCFINSSLQALVAVPAIRRSLAAGTSETESALRAVLGRLESARQDVVPTEVTDRFYRGRQEDAAEFLLLLLTDCQVLHAALRGVEVPLFRCRHCPHQRSSQSEEFLTLCLPLTSDRPLLSLQEALLCYVEHTQIQDGFRGWCCENPECISAERALDAPIAATSIATWPEVLMLQLKRWEHVHNVIGHKVHCNETLTVAGHQYRLQSLIAHIGSSANAGHYVAYTRHGAGFVRLSDRNVSLVHANLIGDFVSLPDEKIYIAFYVLVPPDALPSVPARAPAIDLDTDTDSDIIVEHDHAELKPNCQKRLPDSDTTEASAKKARVEHYTGAELHQIATILKKASTFGKALTQLEEEIPNFTTSDKNSPRYVAKTTLHYKFSNPDSKGVTSQSWQEESKQYFRPFQQRPCVRNLQPASNKPQAWAQRQSWTFCSKCGRHRPRTQPSPAANDVPCKPHCDPCPQSLLVAGQHGNGKLMAYVTPAETHWHDLLAALKTDDLAKALTAKDLDSLIVVRLYVDYKTVRGGKSEITSMKKQSVVRAEWREQPLQQVERSPAAAKAFAWLMDNNCTYKQFVTAHAELHLENASEASTTWRRIPTAELLLRQPGIEVAARPWLYPWASYGDTDIGLRLRQLQHIKASSKPSLRASWERKATSRCSSYAEDFHLQSLLYDVAMARTISTVASLAASKKMAPEAIASDMDMFDAYWQHQIEKMEDICRLEFERHHCLDKAMPSVFLIVAPAEWTFPLHEGIFFEDSLTKQQTMLTRHIYHVLDSLLQEHILKEGPHQQALGLAGIRQWSFRFEFQSRGTVHIHCVLWADFLPGVTTDMVTGRTGEKHQSLLVRRLEELFSCRVDVQAGKGHHNMMRYVMGYVQKASDALSFKSSEVHSDTNTTWRTTYRLLCKKAPLEQEMALEFAGLSMVRHSFLGANYYAPIPGSEAINLSRSAYKAFQTGLREGFYGGYSFLSWLRDHRIEPLAQNTCKVTSRQGRTSGRGCNKDVGVAMHFPFELLDIFIGAWAATFLPNMDERRLLPDKSRTYPNGYDLELVRRNSFEAPEGCRHLKAVLCLNEFQLKPDYSDFTPDVHKLLVAIEQDLLIRGLTTDRIATFKARVHACALLLQKVYNKKENPEAWSARRIFQPPQRDWSKEQQEVLISVADANLVRETNRMLHVKGGPGTGKTEVIIAAAQQAIDNGCRVLIAGPIGLLVSLYRTRLAPSPNLTMETLHASFKVTRSADEQYVPPGRLRSYDLIILDEVSQIDAHVWRLLQTALAELYPQPFIVFLETSSSCSPSTACLSCKRTWKGKLRKDYCPQSNCSHTAQLAPRTPSCWTFCDWREQNSLRELPWNTSSPLAPSQRTQVQLHTKLEPSKNRLATSSLFSP